MRKETVRDAAFALSVMLALVAIGFILLDMTKEPEPVRQSPLSEAPAAETIPVRKVTITHVKPRQDCIWNDAGRSYRCSYLDARGVKAFEPRDGGRKLFKPYGSPWLEK